jgi:hypothetical protein
MFKTNDQRLRQALDAIRLHAGPAQADYIDEELTRGVRLRFAHLLEMGGYQARFRNADEKSLRNAVRGLLLVGLVLGRIQDTDVNDKLKRDLLATPLEEIARRMKRLFPFRAFSGRYSNLESWAPSNFTTPTPGRATNYRFIVHSVMADMSKVAQKGFSGDVTQMQWDDLLDRYDESIREIKTVTKGKGLETTQLWVNFARQYLQSPDILRFNIISATLISQAKHATYYPFGFILSVPQENVYSTAAKDQGVKNRTGNAIAELQRVYSVNAPDQSQSRIWTPDEVLTATSGANGATGYNEIVLVGTSPEGKEVKANGIFVKIAPNGNLYVRPGETKPYLTDELLKLIKSSKLPLVKIVDSTSAPSTFPIA